MTPDVASADQDTRPAPAGGLPAGGLPAGRSPLLARLARWRPRGRSTPVTVAILAGSALLIGYLGVVPLAYLLWGTLYDGQAVTLRFFRSAYSAYGLGPMLLNSGVFALGATAVSVVVGTTMAYLTVRTNAPLKSVVFMTTIIPLILPGILYTIAWVFLASPNTGLVNTALEPVLGPARLNVFSMPGMIVVQGLHLTPLVFLLMYAALRSMDPALEEAAMTSGARLWQVIRRVTLPLVRPALLGAVLVMMVLSLEAFEVPALLGMPAGRWVFTTRIFRVLKQFPPGYGEAGAYSLSLLVLTSLGILVQARLLRSSRRFQTITGKGFRARPMDLGRWRPLGGLLIVLYATVAVVLPLLILLYAAFQPYYSPPTLDTLRHLTLNNFHFALFNDDTYAALKTSLVLGVGTATAVMFLMAVVSWLVVRSRIPGRWLLDNLASLPLAIPGVVLGVALLFVYLRSPVPVYGTIWLLFIGFATRFMPYGMRYASNSMFQVSGELEECAQVSGASWWQMFRRIDLPLLTPGLLAGWVYILLVSVRELSSAILLYSPDSKTLSVIIWSQWQNGQLTDVAALGVVLVAALAVIVAVAHRLGARFGVREG